MAQPESRLRARCRLYLDHALPEPCTYSAIEHGRKHSGTQAQRAREWMRLKAQGVKAGVFDLIILAPGKFIGCELKAGKNTLSEAQQDWAKATAANSVDGSHVALVIRSILGLHDALVGIGILIQPSMRILAMSYDACLSVPEKPKKKGRGQGDMRVIPKKPSLSTIRRFEAARSKTPC